jgi:hypothetical protein
VVSDVPVDDEAPLVTSGISRSVGAQSFGGAHRGRVCVHVFIGVSVHACCVCVVLCNSQKNKSLFALTLWLIYITSYNNNSSFNIFRSYFILLLLNHLAFSTILTVKFTYFLLYNISGILPSTSQHVSVLDGKSQGYMAYSTRTGGNFH